MRVPFPILSSCALGLMALGCGPTTTAGISWTRALSHVRINNGAMTPSGDLVLGGLTQADERILGPRDEVYENSSSPSRPVLVRIAEDGTLVHEWTGFRGQVQDVATDEQGRAYVVLSGLPEGDVWSETGACELRALDTTGEVRWVRRPTEDQPGCPDDLAVAQQTLLVRDGDLIEGLDLDGTPRWSTTVPNSITSLRTAVTAGPDALWVTEVLPTESDSTRLATWRFDAADGSRTDLELDMPGWDILSLGVVEDQLWAVMLTPYRPDEPGELRLASFRADNGRLQWSRHLTTAESPAPPATWSWGGTVLSRGESPWLVGSQWRVPADEPTIPYHRMVLERWSPDGARQVTMHRAFMSTELEAPIEDEPDDMRSDCSYGESRYRGSAAHRGFTHDNGDTLVVVGRQECRHSFVMKMEVTR